MEPAPPENMQRFLTAEQKRSITATTAVLLWANLLPLVAVWKRDWGIEDLLLLYWVETLLVGALNLLRMMVILPEGRRPHFHFLKVAFVPFFAGHFGLYCLGIGVVFQLVTGRDDLPLVELLHTLVVGDGSRLFWPLVIAYFLSFCWNYLGQGEFRRTTISTRMTAPYLRVVPSNLLAAGGAFALSFTGWGEVGLYLFIAAKALADLWVHIVLHQQWQRTEISLIAPPGDSRAPRRRK